ncbi:poly-beta-1,6-N-acetyl-D-glucosamine N-deacetylase PgaB [Frateuria edaphi]|uniref:poly-beta-1,6-N-acetyl-D-glucosamine N-deacetylase PgaB n=1 Tax=Frateuria edaphi TaxID=2898793 RepID=UPI001E3A1ADC|nr:poly-beta-1,6-N-acetyl-D-glucosamine N-deacetylase PgaB [Frateuria edaphi]UGB45268.1 poly-beta-1,6-N-acetyl-D-glucosamine N-deacetylase PgaB [Frateuria edaphi]
MRYLILALLLLLAVPAHAGRLVILSYHDIHDPAQGPTTDPDATSLDHLVGHLEYLHANGWTAVSPAQVRAAAHGGPALPDKAFLLTFDDGLESFYTQVYPLLQAYHYPALLALVTGWIETAPGDRLDYNGRDCDASCFVTWAQVREMQRSGLVEIASHSDALHEGIVGNPQGNLLPSAVTRRYDPAAGSYETEAAWRERITEDLTRSAALIREHTGQSPHAIVWPYGAFNRPAREIAATLGMEMSLTLGNAVPDPVRDHTLDRLLLGGDPGVADLAWQLMPTHEVEPRRVVQVDLDYVYDPDPAQRERNLSQLLDRIKRMDVDQVWLQAYADPDGDGVADALYFPNRHLPMRADLFSRVAWQLQTRAGVHVYAWMPALAFRPRAGDPVAALGLAGDGKDVARLDPSQPAVRAWIGDLYEDLASHAKFDGLLFSDDALLRDTDRLHDAPSPGAARTAWLVDYTHALIERARRWRPQLRTARNLFAAPVLDGKAEAWFAQSLPAFVAGYDEVGLMAMPQLDEAKPSKAWFERLAAAVAAVPGAREKTVFELAAQDWRTRQPIDATTLLARMRLLQVHGALHLGYYPDDFPADHPELERIRPGISSATYPYKER